MWGEEVKLKDYSDTLNFGRKGFSVGDQETGHLIKPGDEVSIPTSRPGPWPYYRRYTYRPI